MLLKKMDGKSLVGGEDDDTMRWQICGHADD